MASREFKDFEVRTNEIENIVGMLVEDSPKGDFAGAQKTLTALQEEIGVAFDDTDDDDEMDILQNLLDDIDEIQTALDNAEPADEDDDEDEDDDDNANANEKDAEDEDGPDA
jgi:hypothetical protein